MKTKNKLSRALVAIVTASLVSVTLAVSGGGAASAAEQIPGVPAIEQRNAQTVTADSLPTVQIDSGIVWAQAVHGNVVYAGGSFSQTRPAGTAQGSGTPLTPRSNILAYDVTTGNLLPFAPEINGTVKSLALSPDGSTLYVGGTFTKVGTETRFNVAAFNTATGQLSTTFRPAVGGSYVNAIVATNDVVYFGGLIGAIGGQVRKNFAAASVSGQVLGWAPTSDLQVDSMVLAPGGGRLIAAGRFSMVNGAPQRGLAALDLSNGAMLPWSITSTVKNGTSGGKAGIWALSADAKNVYGTGWVFADVNTGNLEGLFAADGQTGNEVWIADCHGDHYGVYSDGTNVYSTGHEHECTTAGGLPQGNGTMRNATVYTAAAKGTLSRSPYVNNIYADWSGHPAPAAVNWFPEWLTGTASGMGQAAWTVTGNDEYVVFGGEFVGINNQSQQGLSRFARTPSTGAKQGPRLSGASWTPTARSVAGGTIDVSITSNWDRDDRDLAYELWEEGSASATTTITRPSTFWNTPQVKLKAAGLAPGSTHTFRVVAKDGDGNAVTSPPVSATVSSTPVSAYAAEVLDTDPTVYWPFDQPSPNLDWAGNSNAILRSGVGSSTDSAVAGGNNSATFDGSSNGYAVSNDKVAVTKNYSIELWFKANSGRTGKLLGYGSSQSGNSGSYDRHVYLDNSGRLIYGNYSGSTDIVSTSQSYTDNKWHHVVASQGSSGVALYVDGQLKASNAAFTNAEGFVGYWRVGGDNLGSWPNQPSNEYFNGRIDEVAVYSKVLTAQEVSRHFAIGVGVQPPTASFAVTGTDLSRSFDASASTAAEGHAVAGYKWNFGDNSATATGATAQHTYQTAGTYTVTLTVTDNTGLSDVETSQVTVTAPHQAPTAAFTKSVSGLRVDVDPASSTAHGDATIVGAEWNFGDGATSTDLAATHRYTQAGTFEVSLVVTDSMGAKSAPATASVVATHAAPTASFGVESSGLALSVDAATSVAVDDATLAYSWNWGDASALGEGVQATHVYAESGQYTVTLTVTDSFGATATTTNEVVIDDFIARDSFERTVANGWGTADVGGVWTGTAGLSVSGGAGKLSVDKSQTRNATLTNFSASSFDANLVLTVDKVANGGGIHVNVMGRKGGGDEYRGKLRISATGVVTANLAQLVGGTETLLAAKTVTGYTFTPGASLNVRYAIDGAEGSTLLKLKIWPQGSNEPTDWTVTASSSTASLQDAGAFGIGTYATGTVTNGPVVVSISDVTVKGASEASAHIPPTAVIDATPSGLTVAYSASQSSVFDGATITGYEWNFGDGSTSTDAAPQHVYAAAGPYTATLVVTDSAGARSEVVSKAVSVTHVAPKAEFNASMAELVASTDASATVGYDGAAISSYTWNWGDSSPQSTGVSASHTYAAAGTYTVTLTVVDSMGATSTTTRSVLATTETFIARDSFERDVATGWGPATVGGAWTGGAGMSVQNGMGTILVGKSQTRSVSLSSVAVRDSDSRFSVSTDRVADGGGVHVNYDVHATTNGSYRAKLRISATGVVNVGVAKVIGTTETLIANRALTGYTHTANTRLEVRVSTVTTGASTTVNVKVWPAGTAEPAAWTATTTDSEAALQVPGAVTFLAYASGTVTNGPVAVTIDDLIVK